MARFYARDTAADIRVYLCEAGGRVGIGNTAPAYKLDVNGDIRTTTGKVYIGTGGSYLDSENTTYGTVGVFGQLLVIGMDIQYKIGEL